jgi:predicted dehydrogenase
MELHSLPMAERVKIGVMGVGHLGKIHLRLLKEISGFEVVGFYDPDDATATSVAEKFGITRYESPSLLLEHCDAVDIVSPTTTHYENLVAAAKQFKHIFVEKPLATDLNEARKMVSLVEEAGIKAMVGHVERFNPAFLSVAEMELQPVFIETHRLAMFNPRGTDVSVVLDLMIHDIDIILSIVKANVKRISASGVAVVSASPDIANARIEFDNGCVANVTASRISIKQMRKMRVFQPGAYISMDFLEKKSNIIRIADEPVTPQSFELELPGNQRKYITLEAPEPVEVNAIKLELEHFLDAIQKNHRPPVTIYDGYHALEVAHRIIDKINLQLRHT